MKKRELSAEMFLNEYKNKEYFIGAILTGSYATGNQNKNSDIDIFVITSDNTNWRERGTKLAGNYLIEYFINPVKQIKKYMEEELVTYNLSTTRMFANGKILMDKKGIARKRL